MSAETETAFPDGGRLSQAELEAISERLDSLDDRVRANRFKARLRPLETARNLLELEREFFELARHPAVGESLQVTSTYLSGLQYWRSLCRRVGMTESIAAIDDLANRLLEKEAAAWDSAAGEWLREPSADVCFEILMQTTTMLQEACRENPQSPPGQSALKAVREQARKELRECIVSERPSADDRRRWARELVDRTEMVLTSIDDLPPGQAAEQLQLVLDDITWHLQHIESRFSQSGRSLRRKRNRLDRERQERVLQHRLESRYGPTRVAFAERTVLFLIFFVIALISLEAFVDLSPRATLYLDLVDGLICTVFLTEFGIKLWHAPNRRSWFLRHFLIDFIPSIPLGLLTTGLSAANALDTTRYGRLIRLFRLPRLVRYMRVLRPIVRVIRAFGLLTRGLDRLARRFGHLLNQNVILYPTRAELHRAAAALPTQQAHFRRLRNDARAAWKRVVLAANQEQLESIAEMRMQIFETALAQTTFAPQIESNRQGTQVREIPAEQLIERLGTVTSQDIEANFGEDLIDQLARMTRLFARAPLRWFPIIRKLAPHVTEEMTNAEVIVAGSRRTSTELSRLHRKWFFAADLYGTVSPSQFVDRVGSMLMQNSIRPAYRLAVLGATLLFAKLVLMLLISSGSVGEEVLSQPPSTAENSAHSESVADQDPSFAHWIAVQAHKYANTRIGETVLALGSICFVVLAIGWWLKSMAREATEFYERAAQAQFLWLTETVRARHLETDIEILYDRVLRPEWVMNGEPISDGNGQPTSNRESTRAAIADPDRESHLEQFRSRIEGSLVATHSGGGNVDFIGLENVILLYRDWLDGAIFTDNDTRVTSQLLGNPAVRQAVGLSTRIDKQEVKRLQSLDLVNQKSLFGGPYLWFNFIARSISHSVAALIVEYNRNAIPSADLPMASKKESRRFHRWLAEKESDEPTAEEAARSERLYITTAFTAPHFLDCDPTRDQDIAARFGREVLDRLITDRSLLIRRVFGTFPRHEIPKEDRVVNLHTLYLNWLSGGKALLLPWFLFVAGLRATGRFFKWLGTCVIEIRKPDRRKNRSDAASAFFVTAVRKIDRIRGPVVDAAMRLRMQLDPEYLGVPLPGQSACSLWGCGVDADLDFVAPTPAFHTQVDRARRRAEADMVRLERHISDGLLKRAAERVDLPSDAFLRPEHRRAAAVSYFADFRNVRRHLSAETILKDVFERVATEPIRPASFPLTRLRLRRSFRRYWKQHGFGSRRERRAAWRAVVQNVEGVAGALRVWNRLGENASAVGERILGELLTHPSRITEQLVTLRAIQSLAVLDVLRYREHVYRLGRYEEMGDPPDLLLEWDTTLEIEAETSDARTTVSDRAVT